MKYYVRALICIAVLLGIVCTVKDYYDTKTVNPNDIGFEINNNVQPWNLILINKTNEMTDSLLPDLVTTENGEKIAQNVYFHLEELFRAAEEAGFSPELTSGCRSRNQQEDIFDDRINEYRELGYSKKEATSLTNNYAARPGYSEHETGLAADINSADGDSRKLYEWLKDNAYRYGFILRYPKGKEDITGIEYEPWHYRYVGTEAAEYIYHNDMTLEEYLLK